MKKILLIFTLAFVIYGCKQSEKSENVTEGQLDSYGASGVEAGKSMYRLATAVYAKQRNIEIDFYEVNRIYDSVKMQHGPK